MINLPQGSLSVLQFLGKGRKHPRLRALSSKSASLWCLRGDGPAHLHSLKRRQQPQRLKLQCEQCEHRKTATSHRRGGG